jgi:hypothetical protein
MPILRYKEHRDEYKDIVICECECGSSDHRLIFDKFWWVNKEGKSECEYISVYLGPQQGLSIFGRIKIAWKYVFRHHKIYYTNDVLFNTKNIEQLKEAVTWIEESVSERIIDKE